MEIFTLECSKGAHATLSCRFFRFHQVLRINEGTRIAEKLPELPHTPTIIALGSIFKKESFVACEQQLLFTEAVDFLEATCLLLLSYYIFNLAYTDPVTTTLEFLLREMFNVNPERDSKLSNGRKSRTTMDNRIMKLVQWTTR
ncbi:uncharacterized protein LOC119168122 [Rhipicephalus microplus]|uniref:uncharacterized protein LOC119168122 n=1 Tax=Rhipicephalus microplus TaxID=6941 RepID=UPI003F6C4857